MNVVSVYSKVSKKKHLVDAEKYQRVSKSKSLCGLNGKSYCIPNAIYFHEIGWTLCKKCKCIVGKKNNITK